MAFSLLYGENERVGQWVNRRCGVCHRPYGNFQAIGILNNETLVGGLCFFDEQVRDISVAMALDSPLSAMRGRIADVMAYPFIQLEKPRVSAQIAVSNKRSRKFVEGMGFVLEGIKRQAANDGEDLAVYGLLREDFKFKEWIDGRTKGT